MTQKPDDGDPYPVRSAWMSGGEDAVGGVVKKRFADQLHLACPVEMINEYDMTEQADVLQPCCKLGEQLNHPHGVRLISTLDRRFFLGYMAGMDNAYCFYFISQVENPDIRTLMPRFPAFNCQGLAQYDSLDGLFTGLRKKPLDGPP